ncbi:hypothetical protein UVI_02014810 [Ustilaginoidea virens]|uniref:Uncharacterized protein n=1 Tax=Ustilaginoidea virens TaxID=1159556 RepID=A0A1B5L5X1_USTVR|nr:hypothetical protein UVI_02014810 [Ustilaginoidea virens]
MKTLNGRNCSHAAALGAVGCVGGLEVAKGEKLKEGSRRAQGGIEEASRRHRGGIEEASRRHRGGIVHRAGIN